jgi:signal transduction histidine kinase
MENNGESNENISSPIIKCDENRVMQVLLGLQSNALKFTEKGHVHIKVQIIHGGYLQI